MKKILLFSILFFYISAFSQKMNKSQVYEKYLKNGAYMYSYFNPKSSRYLDSALVYLPKDPYLLQQKSMPLFKKKKYEVGMKYLDEAVKYDDESYTYLGYRAFIKCIFQKNYSGAINDFDVLISHYQKGIIMDHSYYFYKALSLIQLNRFDEAKKNLNISLNLFKENKIDSHPLELFYMGIIYYEQENFLEAINYFDQSLQKYPSFSDALYYKGEAYYSMHKEKEALECLIKSSENLKKGYTINEDNAFYEDYPYQIKKWMIQGYFNVLNYSE